MGGLKSNGKKGFLQRFRSSKKNRSQKDSNVDSSNLTPTKQRPDNGNGNTTPPLSPAAACYTDYPQQAYRDDFEECTFDDEPATFDDEPAAFEKPKNYYGSTAKDGTPVISSKTADHFKASQVQEYAGNVGPKGRVMKVLKDMPSAKEAAFSGPPRYDWIDIETAAAVKVQAAYRRNKVMSMLEREGKSTAAMRNRSRARKTKQRNMINEDVPSALRFCGLGFLFGDATGEDQNVLNARKKTAYAEKKKAREVEEEEKRKFRFRKKECEELVEGVEVVEDT